MHKKKIIDIEHVVKTKNPRLYRWIPRFVFSLFKKLILQEKINKLLYENRNKTSIDFASELVRQANVTPHIHYRGEIDPHKRYIFACNHPLGGLDAFSFATLLRNKLTNFKFIVNDILMNLTGLESLFLPINKHGMQVKAYAKLMDEAYSSDTSIIIFPAGLVSRKQGKQVMDLKWHKNFIHKAIQYQRDIVPVHIIAQNSSFFYNFARWREKLGIKINIEMILLPREFFNFKDQDIHIIVGEPIPYNKLSKGANKQEWADEIKKTTYALSL